MKGDYKKTLKANKTNGFKSCILISVYQLEFRRLQKATEYDNDW